VTLAEVARKAGVSITTASRVFNDNPSVRDYLRERVLAAADEMGYRPNALARGLRTRYANLVSLGIQQTENPFFGAMVGHLSKRLLAANYGAVVCNNIDRVNEINQTARAAGTILVAPAARHIREVVQERALVTITAPEPQLSLASNVAIDFPAAYRETVQALRAAGRSRVAFLCPASDWEVNQRTKFSHALNSLTEAGCPAANPPDGYFATAQAVAEAFAAGPAIDAVLCSNDLQANTLCHHLWQSGIRPGSDVLVVGCDGTLPQDGVWTIEVDIEEIAEATVELLLSGMNESQQPRETTVRPVLRTN
jgi:LacI family transcriptional regulator